MDKPPSHAHLAKCLRRPIILVGMMGSGKTTIGRRLSYALGVPFFDADKEIERAAGLNVSDIFESFGEQSFRDGERRVIERLIGEEDIHVLATGGGAFVHPQTRAILLQKGLTIWLRAEIDILAARTARRDTRPLLRDGNRIEILRKLSAERDPLYAQAHITVDSVSGPHHQVVTAILDLMENFDHQPPNQPPSQQEHDEPDDPR